MEPEPAEHDEHEDDESIAEAWIDVAGNGDLDLELEQEDSLEVSVGFSNLKGEVEMTKPAEGKDMTFAVLGRDVLGLIAAMLPSTRDSINFLTLTSILHESYLSGAFDFTFYHLMRRDFSWALRGERMRQAWMSKSECKVLGTNFMGRSVEEAWIGSDFVKLYRACFEHVKRRDDAIAIPVMVRIWNLTKMTAEWRELYREPEKGQESIVFEIERGDSVHVDVLWAPVVAEFNSYCNIVRWSYGPVDLFKAFGSSGKEDSLRADHNRTLRQKLIAREGQLKRIHLRGAKTKTVLRPWRLPKTSHTRWHRIQFSLATKAFKNQYPAAATADGKIEPSFSIMIHHTN